MGIHEDLQDFGRGFMRICETLGEDLLGFVRIHLGEDSQGFTRTLGEDLWGFTRLLERICWDLQGFTRLWERICETLGRIHGDSQGFVRLWERICNDS